MLFIYYFEHRSIYPIILTSFLQYYLINTIPIQKYQMIIEAGILTINLFPNYIGLFFIKLIMIMYIPITLYVFYYIRFRPIQIIYIYGSLTTAILAGFANNLTTTFIAYELLTLTTIPLIYKDHSPQSIYYLKQYIKQLITTALFLFLPAVLWLNTYIPNLEYTQIYNIHEHLPLYQVYILLFMLMLGVVKAAILPLKWLIYAAKAEYPVSAVLHSVSIVKAGLISLMKILYSIFGMEFITMLDIIKIPIQLSIIYSAIKAYKTTHHKRTLIFSTMGQLSTIFLIFITNHINNIDLALQAIYAHSYIKLSLFIIFSKIYLTKQSDNINQPNPAINLIDIILLTIAFYKLAGFSGIMYT
ncbi:MAG: proton-conducting transporter membrane subunit, partial [Pseudomonadota bacterium]